MKSGMRGWRLGVIALLLGLSLSACVADYGGYGGDVGIGYVGHYYEPGGYGYGGWGPGYRVGPPRGGESGARGHVAPSIPRGARGGGAARGGGGRGH